RRRSVRRPSSKQCANLVKRRAAAQPCGWTAAAPATTLATLPMLETGCIAQGQIRLDDRDIRILAILQREGRITKAALAERVHLTPTPCWERLKRLEEAGVIEGYGAQISLRALGPRLTVFVEVFLESHDSEAATHFETAMADFSNIVGCWAVGGGFDYLLKVV